MTTVSLERERFTSYALARILPDGDVLVLDSDQSVLSHLHGCMIVEQQMLSPSEMYVVLSLLSNYPEYCPYEVVLSEITGRSVDVCRQRLIVAEQENGTVDAVMRPVRNLMGRVRMKLRPFGIQIKSMINTGYMLIPAGRGMRS